MQMQDYDKRLLKLAIRIHSEVKSRQSNDRTVRLPEQSWQECQIRSRRLHRAIDKRLTLATDRIRSELQQSVLYLQQKLEALSHQLRSVSSGQFASPQEIFRDLVALRDEFDGVEWDASAHTISVTTDRVVLDGIDLGPFEIRLHWDRLNCSQPYEVVALEPNPSSLNESVNHPHVQDDALCEGEGRYSIGRALEEGRLLDFFFLVRGVLTTYNASSAYVSLARWNGTVCPACDDVVSEDDLTACFNCEGTTCFDCSLLCVACNETHCSSCSDYCSDCGQSLCLECRKRCQRCSAVICPLCSNENRCNHCYEKTQAESDQTMDDDPNDSVQPLGLGETHLPA